MKSFDRFAQALSELKTAVVVGDFLLDCYEFGQVNRISPEAPVPIFKYERREYRPGGAGNVVQNLQALGVQSDCVGLVGHDAEGEQLTQVLSKRLGANIEAIIRSPRRPTPLKTRLIARGQQMLRMDREEPALPTENEQQLLQACLQSVTPEATHVFVSDYGKGVVGSKTVAAIHQRQPRAWIAVDPRGKSYEKYAGCSLITPNQQEAELATDMPVQSEDDIRACLKKLGTITQAQYVCMTRHEHGMTLLDTQRQEIVHQEAWSKRDVFDVTGAGDTVLVFLSLALSFGLPVRDALILASGAAYLVIQKFGASSVTLPELRHLMRQPPTSQTRTAF